MSQLPYIICPKYITSHIYNTDTVTVNIEQPGRPEDVIARPGWARSGGPEEVAGCKFEVTVVDQLQVTDESPTANYLPTSSVQQTQS